MNRRVQDFIDFIRENDGIGDKRKLTAKAVTRFELTKDRSVYYTKYFAVRFSYAATQSFSNTVLSLSNLQKYDEIPFIVCVIRQAANQMFLANSTFLAKISHSSHEFRENNIRGSFNGSDIMKEVVGFANSPENFEKLFAIHAELGFAGNLNRLVEATHDIKPTGHKLEIDEPQRRLILAAVPRTLKFIKSSDYKELLADLDARVKRCRNEIIIASMIDNVNIRGRIIEYLIAGEDESLRKELIEVLQKNENTIPRFSTDNTLGDYRRDFADFLTETDVKTKVMVLNSNPKAYNIDKMLEFLCKERTVFMFYFVGIDPGKIVNTVLVSLFQSDILKATILLRHWAGRNSRGVTQLEGKAIHDLIIEPNHDIDEEAASHFLQNLIDM